MMFEAMTERKFTDHLADGPLAWPGDYPVYFIAADGRSLCFASVEANAELIAAAIRENTDGPLRIVACQINWNDQNLFCAITGERIPAAFTPAD